MSTHRRTQHTDGATSSFILSTIVIGLLIALGLEQSAEAIHHRRQLREARRRDRARARGESARVRDHHRVVPARNQALPDESRRASIFTAASGCCAGYLAGQNQLAQLHYDLLDRSLAERTAFGRDGTHGSAGRAAAGTSLPRNSMSCKRAARSGCGRSPPPAVTPRPMPTPRGSLRRNWPMKSNSPRLC